MIFHIFGGQCSGKTSVAEQLDLNVFACWDILYDFYIHEGIIKDNKMDWNKWQFRESKIEKNIQDFIKVNNESKHIAIVSSGTNKKVNKIIKGFDKVIPVNLGVPNDKDIVERVKAKGFDLEQVKEFNAFTRTKFARLSKYLPNVLTVEEAVAFIKEKTTDCG